MTQAGREPMAPALARRAQAHTAIDAEAQAQVQAAVERSGTSFLAGMRVLPRRKRQAMFAIYAFCRTIDDIADEPGDPKAKLAALEDWRREIDRLYRGHPGRPMARALAPAVRDYRLPKEEFLALIDGMEMDAREDIRAPSEADYALYCRRVAGAVGMLSIHVFGEAGPAGRELARVLGEALQTINILRDLAEDAERGRLYLPRELLERHGLRERDPRRVLDDPALAGACAALAERARLRLGRAQDLLARCDRRRVRPARLMLAIYERILRRLEARGWNRPHQPVRVSRPEKLWILLRHGLV